MAELNPSVKMLTSPVVKQLFLPFANGFQSSESSRFSSAMLTCNFRIKKRLIVLSVSSHHLVQTAHRTHSTQKRPQWPRQRTEIWYITKYVYVMCIYIYVCHTHTHMLVNVMFFLFFTLICICLKLVISKIKKVFNRLQKTSHLHLLHLAQLSSPDLVWQDGPNVNSWWQWSGCM